MIDYEEKYNKQYLCANDNCLETFHGLVIYCENEFIFITKPGFMKANLFLILELGRCI